jgi:hypothetical protein
MGAIITNPADVVNLAMVKLGRNERVGSLYEGSKWAKAALSIYGQTRDALLRAADYGFSERNVNATPLKQAPAGGYTPQNPWNGANNPPPPWVYEYQYPSDALKIRSVKPIPIFVMNFDPQPKVFAIENDNSFTPAQKVILCNVPNAQLVYTAQVTDPTTWEVDFVDEFADALARGMALALANMETAKFVAAEEGQAVATAMAEEG